MKLTEQKLRKMIREVLQNEDFGQPIGNWNPGAHHDPNKKSTVGSMKAFGPGYSSKEAQTLVSKNVKQNSKLFKQLKYKIIKGWMDLAKSGHVDFFDIIRGVTTGDIRRAEGNELDLMKSMLMQNHVENAFRRYFKGKKSLPTRKWK